MKFVIPYIPANFSNTSAILQTSFLKPHNSLKSTNFLETSAFYSVSICCFDFNLCVALWFPVVRLVVYFGVEESHQRRGLKEVE